MIGPVTEHALALSLHATADAIPGTPPPLPGAEGHDAGREGSVSEPSAATPAATPATPEALHAGALERGFGGDQGRLRRFLGAIRPALPDGTVIGLRGSAVVGSAYETGAPFDAAGPGTSDLDVVIVGDDVMDLFAPDAQLLGGINTLPLCDKDPWVAPSLDRARRKAQSIVRRPVSIQAMPRWFLDLRSLVQDQPYVILSDDR